MSITQTISKRTHEVANDGIPVHKGAQLRSLSQTPDEQRATETLKKRAKSKYISTSLALSLINANQKSELRPSYWRTYKCSRSIYISSDGVTTQYCKNRFCLTCARIKTATMINKYEPVVSQFENPVFVTLTIPNIKADELRPTIEQMQRDFYSIINLKSNRGNMHGIRKTESTYNPYRNDYHPHFHVLIDGFENAIRLYDSWLNRNPHAHKKGQDIKIADQGSMMELFKYLTKINISLDKEDKRIYPKALDTIFRAFRNKRTIGGFGLPKLTDPIEDYTPLNEVFENDRHGLFEWDNDYCDWIDYETGELLTNYVPDARTTEMINRINNRNTSKSNDTEK